MYCENIADETLLYESLLEKVVKNYPHGNDDVDITVLENVFPTASVFFSDKIEDILSYLLYGFCIILFPNKNKAGIICYSKKTFRQWENHNLKWL
ncbi:spore germination protein [Bacillus sp. MM2020_1]|nr:spore germination protein [Bacillus sp. MM2020_1]